MHYCVIFIVIFLFYQTHFHWCSIRILSNIAIEDAIQYKDFIPTKI